MQQIIYFFIRNKNFLLFAILFIISLAFTISSHSYHDSKFVNSANFFSGGIYTMESNVNDYFHLEEHNASLVEENKRLRQQLEILKERSALSDVKIDTTSPNAKYFFRKGKVINNSYSKTNNHLTILGGARNQIKPDMGVITSKGLIGVVEKTSNKYSVVQSILNMHSQINAKLKENNQFGSLIWDAKDPNVVQLIDIPRIAPVTVGDTIVTGGKSTIFPEGILIGTVDSFDLDQGGNFYTLNVKLFNDMTNLDHVYVIENVDAIEIQTLETGVEENE